MKFQFKWICLLGILFFQKTYARDVILIENLATKKEGQLLLKIIQEKFNIPKKLITFRSINNECAKTSDAIMQLCLKANGELDVVRVNKFAVENSLRVFLETEEL